MGKFRALERARMTNGWTLEERAGLAHFMSERKIPENDPVFVKQAKDRGLYIVDTGGVKVAYEHLSLELHEGESFGELSLLEESPKLVTITGLMPTTLYVLTFEKWLELRKTAPTVAVKLMEAMLKKIIHLFREAPMPPRSLTASGPTPTTKSTGNQPRPEI